MLDLPSIFSLHHPIYSFDVYHSGSSKMADVLENAIRGGAYVCLGYDVGFVTLTIDDKSIHGVTTEVSRTGVVLKTGDTFSYPTKAVVLADKSKVPSL